MIVKFKLDNEEWKVLDNVKNVNYRRIDKDTFQILQEEVPDAMTIHDPELRNYDQSLHNFTDISLVMENSEDLRINTCLSFYLLNDEGKTIERIN